MHGENFAISFGFRSLDRSVGTGGWGVYPLEKLKGALQPLEEKPMDAIHHLASDS